MAWFSGSLDMGGVAVACHVLNDRRRILSRNGMIKAIGISQGGGGEEVVGGRLTRFATGKAILAHLSPKAVDAINNPISFKIGGVMGLGYEATILAELCEAVLAAEDSGDLAARQLHLVKQCMTLLRGFARVGIDALVDEATGYQKIRAKQALQLKLHAFIAEEMQEWARMFPEEFWLELARLEEVSYSPRSRPLRWGKYVMMFVYDAIDGDIGRALRAKNPNPHFLKNHHQWLKKFGRDKVTIQIAQVVAIMEVCRDMPDFKAKFAHVFKKSPLQMDFADINWTLED